jgi:hypothetical protein
MNKRMLSWQSLVYSFGPGETNTLLAQSVDPKQSKAKQSNNLLMATECNKLTILYG